jgi:predicted RNase H-like HicB family nuclease
MKSHYFEVYIEYSKEDYGFVATSPQISGLSAFGATIDEAMMEFGTALSAYMEVQIEDAAKNT